MIIQLEESHHQKCALSGRRGSWKFHNVVIIHIAKSTAGTRSRSVRFLNRSGNISIQVQNIKDCIVLATRGSTAIVDTTIATEIGLDGILGSKG